MASSNDKHDKRNFQWITVASVDLINLPLIDILASYIKPVDLFQKIHSCSTLKLRTDQRKLCLIQPPGLPDYNTFDVTLLYTLIRNLCGLQGPAQGWGKEPKTTDTEISDDIERLRLFRNNYYAHANSSSISDGEFEDTWRNLKLAIKRITCNSKIRCSRDYEKEFKELERSRRTEYHLETCRILLDAYAGLQKQTDSKNEPDISIKGENKKKYGETALFEANVEKVESLSWTITWRKRRGNVIECIDTSTEKYSDSTKRSLVIKSVCKEDEGEYQAVLSLVANGPEYKSKNTIRLNVFEDVPSVIIFGNSPVCFGSKTIIKSEISSTTTPEKIEWQKSKDGIDFHCIKEPIFFRTTASFECPPYVIPKTTFTDKLYYRLLVWNENGEGVSNTVYLDVTGSPPNIMTSFETNIKDRSVKLIGNMYVYDDSPGILETFWTKNEKKINPEKSGGTLSEISNENPSLTIRNVSLDDAGEYRLTATNAVGSSTSDAIVLGIPIIFLEKIEDKKNGCHSITVMIESLPAPYHVQWSAKSKDDEHYTPIDINTEEYEGTTVSFPRPVLVVRHRDQLDKNCFKIEVTNFIGKTVHDISGKNNPVVLRSTGKESTEGRRKSDSRVLSSDSELSSDRGKNILQRAAAEKKILTAEEEKIMDEAKYITLSRPSTAHLFSKGAHNQKEVLPSIVKADVSKSVGLIHIDGNAMGTGFRVGEKYIVTCEHVIKDATVGEHIICIDRVSIAFGRTSSSTNRDSSRIFDIISMAYLDKEHDFVVLELGTHDSGVPFPPALTCFGKVCWPDVHLVGHPNCTQMMEDSVIPFWLPEHNDIIKPYINKLGSWSKIFFPGDKDHYEELSYPVPRKIMFHTTFNHGSSGSPGVIIREEKPCVVLMVRGGVPACVYDNTYPNHTPLVQDSQKVEYGYAMEDIYKKMSNSPKEKDKNLASELFKIWRL